MSKKKLSVFGIGRRTVGRGPGVVAALPACPQGHNDRRKSLRHHRLSASWYNRSTMTSQPQNVGQHHVSPSVAHRSPFWAISRIPVTTSGELILLPVWYQYHKLNVGRCPLTSYEVQRFRHSAVVFAHFSGILHFPRPKYRLKLFPIPIMTWNFDFLHPVSYYKVDL